MVTGTSPLLSELEERGYCIVRECFRPHLIDACRDAFWPILSRHLQENANAANRGPHRHFLAMPFTPPCFATDFFFSTTVLLLVQGILGDRIVADQWGCDAPVLGSAYQDLHVDFQRPLFEELPDLALPPYMLVVSFGLTEITSTEGPIEIAPGTHRMSRSQALRAVETGAIPLCPVTLALGDVLIRHPWALHRGTPNTTPVPRALLSIRYVRQWYADRSRTVASLPRRVWESLTEEQQAMLRFPVADS